MADRKPLARYGAVRARSLAACSAELHHHSGRDHCALRAKGYDTTKIPVLLERKKQWIRTVGASVTFEPGARTAWHTHPLGQTLIVTSGLGWVQRWGEPKEEIRPGDVIWFPPGEKHWHGAAATTAMTHIAIVEQLNGKSADWMEKVSDDQYGA